MYFNMNIILLHQIFSDKDQALSKMADVLYDHKAVTTEYKQAILNRESQFPTGLLLPSMGVAIPHTESDKVITSQIAFAQLEEPIIFQQMSDNKLISVQLIFMLALKDAHKQPIMLQNLMQMFQDDQLMQKIKTVTTVASFKSLMDQAHIL